MELQTAHPTAKLPLGKRILRLIFPEKRRSERHLMPPLVARIGVSYAQKCYKVGDVSSSGVYLVTQEKWMPGTQLPINLQRTDTDDPGAFVTVMANVVRNGRDGVGFSFLLADVAGTGDESEMGEANWASQAAMNGFLTACGSRTRNQF
jgi:hypothetical protein